MPPAKKERFNAKARQSSVGSSHKKRRKIKEPRRDEVIEGIADEGSNALIIDPKIESARGRADQQRRDLLAIRDSDAASQPISSKKRKRLDAYITRQLKKEKRQNLMADLANSSAQVEDRSSLMTAATLGTGKVLTGQERLQHDAAKVDRVQQRRRGGNVYSIHDADESDSDEASSEKADKTIQDSSHVDPLDNAREARIAAARALFEGADRAPKEAERVAEGSEGAEERVKPPASVLGSALALGSDGKPLMPTMKKRKKPARRKGSVKTAWGRTQAQEESSSDESSFDSSGTDEDHASEASDGASPILRTNGSDHVNGLQHHEEGTIDESASSLSDDIDSNASDSTDEEEQAILEEAMRRRGMLGDPSRGIPDFDDDDVGPDSEMEGAMLEREASEAESLPFAAFEEENEEEEDRTPSGEGSEVDDSDEDKESSSKEALQSRRRGLAQTDKSSGFKDWAKDALGIAQREDVVEDDGVYRGPEPVAGLSIKVKELMDGTNRGPLGEKEIAMQDRSAFAQNYYEEIASRSAEGKISKDRVAIHRDAAIEESRMMLPTLAEEERIVRTIMENMVTVLCGETGSGKTTQVPQFLYEAGFGSAGSSNPGMIGITQPRRVAALSMAARVGKELNVSSSIVSYQIRYDATVNPSTKIKFMTDGVLLREMATDFLLTRYSAIIIDEAHERSVNTDVLIGVLSRIVKLRAKRWMEGQGRPLRLIIMSATLRVDDFIANTRLFDQKPPVIEIDARQFPVSIHFNRRTSHDYVTESVKKASKIHARLPPGGILIFLTGQAEISVVCRKLEKRYGKRAIEERLRRSRSKVRRVEDAEEDVVAQDKVALPARFGDVEAEEVDLSLKIKEEAELALDVDDGRVEVEDAEALDSDGEDEEGEEEYDADLPAELRDDTNVAMHILPLYSLLPSDQQMRVFGTPPANTRLVVVATNVAETSLTIPGVTYVVDCGRSKERKYDPITNIQSFEVGFISKASANQRAGRAGRTGPGHCYRLYSSNVYEEHFNAFAQPEILRTPVDNLVLMMKAMNIVHVSNFPFPTPPDQEAVQRAEKLLLRLGALQMEQTKAKGSNQLKVTELGRLMSLFPLSSRLSKLLVQGHQFDCLPFVIALVAALSVGDPFVKEQSLHESQIPPEDDNLIKDEEGDLPIEAQHLHNQSELDKEKKKAKRGSYFRALNQFAALGGAMSDPLRLLNAVGAYEHAGGTIQFCQDHYLLPKAMQEIHKLRAQLSSMVQANAEPGYDWSHLNNPRFKSPPTEKQLTILRQFLAAAFIDQIAIRADLAPESAARIPMLQEFASSSDYHIAKQFQHQIRNGAKMKSTRDVAYLAIGVPGEACFIHNSSVLYHQAPPEWIVYTEVFRGQSRGELLDVPGKSWLKGVTKINPNWIHKLGKSLCSFSRTIEIDQQDTRSKLIEAAKELKRRQGSASISNAGEKQVYVVPTYGNGPAFDLNERSSHLGWELPAVAAKQRLIGGKWITEL